MHDDLKSFKKNHTKNFANLIKLEKPQIFQQTPKVRSQKMKCVRKE